MNKKIRIIVVSLMICGFFVAISGFAIMAGDPILSSLIEFNITSISIMLFSVGIGIIMLSFGVMMGSEFANE